MQVNAVPVRKDDEVSVVRGTYKVWVLLHAASAHIAHALCFRKTWE